MLRTKVLISVLLITSLTGCSSQKRVVDPTNLDQLASISGDNTVIGTTSADIGQLRLKALEDTSLSLGAQGGLANSAAQINNQLEHDKKYLETIYNFNGMMLSHGVIPPVLVEGDFTLNLSDPDTIRVSDKTYKIVEQARFATTPPNWREYLWMSYSRPEIPNKFLLPRSKEEQMVWAAGIRKGWSKGAEQAHSIFQENLARLNRDYNGMILYRKLLQQHMVSAPYVSRTELGVTGDGTHMSVNDQVLRITEHPQLQTESKNWKAIIVNKENNEPPVEHECVEQPATPCETTCDNKESKGEDV